MHWKNPRKIIPEFYAEQYKGKWIRGYIFHSGQAISNFSVICFQNPSFSLSFSTYLNIPNYLLEYFKQIFLHLCSFRAHVEKFFKENVRGVSHIDFRTQCVIMILAGGVEGLLLMTFWKSENLSKFKVHELTFTTKFVFYTPSVEVKYQS